MTDMVEKVANEIRYACAASYSVENMLCPWDDAPENDKQGWRGIARAAIRALMEPTEEMRAAKKNAVIGMEWPGSPEEAERLIDTLEWQAMLKEALDD